MLHVQQNTKYAIFKSCAPLNFSVAQLVQALGYNPEGRAFDSGWCHWKFSFSQIFRPHSDPGVDSASDRNEY